MKFIKTLMVITIINIVIGTGFIGWNILDVSSKEEISPLSLITGNLTSEEKKEYQQSIEKRAAELGKISAQKVIEAMDGVFSPSAIDYSKVGEPEEIDLNKHLDSILEGVDNKGREAFSKSLKELEN